MNRADLMSPLRRLFPPLTLPLDRDATGRLLPLVVAVLALLVTLLLSAALALHQRVGAWENSLAGHVSVQILPTTSSGADKDGRAEEEGRLSRVLALLRAAPEVAKADVVGSEAMAHLLSPWLGAGPLPEDLPVPALIDVTLRETAGEADAPPSGALQAALQEIPGVVWDDHAAWGNDVRKIAGRVQGVALGLAGLILLAAGLIVVLLVRAGMAVHREAVELLHLMGAPDRLIAAQFRRHIGLATLKGAAAGSALGALLLAGILYGMGGAQDLISPSGVGAGLGGWGVAGVALLTCLGFGVLADLAARGVARRLLAELP